MKNINYYGQNISVSDEVAAFLELDRVKEATQRRSDQRHLNFVGTDIASMPDLFSESPSDPTLEKAFRNLRMQRLRLAYQVLSDDDRN